MKRSKLLQFITTDFQWFFKNMKQRKPISYFVGNGLMLLGAGLLLFIYYPILQVYLFPKEVGSNANSARSLIEIPKLHIAAPIIENVDPFNEKVYQEELTRGIAHAKGTSLPGKNGSIFLFAHSSDVPWRLSRYNTIFFRLGELNKRDEIIIKKDGKEYKYKVYDKKTVWPSEVKYLTDSKEDQLILQTCTPPGTAFQRLLIFAKP